MDLVDDLGIDLAFAVIVERRYRQKIDGRDALELIGRVKRLLETVEERRKRYTRDDSARKASSH